MYAVRTIGTDSNMYGIRWYVCSVSELTSTCNGCNIYVYMYNMRISDISVLWSFTRPDRTPRQIHRMTASNHTCESSYSIINIDPKFEPVWSIGTIFRHRSLLPSDITPRLCLMSYFHFRRLRTAVIGRTTSTCSTRTYCLIHVSIWTVFRSLGL